MQYPQECHCNCRGGGGGENSLSFYPRAGCRHKIPRMLKHYFTSGKILG